jgi:hypothetical protein
MGHWQGSPMARSIARAVSGASGIQSIDAHIGRRVTTVSPSQAALGWRAAAQPRRLPPGAAGEAPAHQQSPPDADQRIPAGRGEASDN